MRLLFLTALLLAACSGSAVAQSSSAVADTFNVRAWLVRTEILWDTTAQAADYDGIRALARQRANELDDALGLIRACELWEEVRTDPEQGWGYMNLEPLGPDEYLLRVHCEHASYNPSFVYVHIDGTQAAVVQAPAFYDGAVQEPTPLFLGYETLDVARRRFSIYTRGTGMGDCGSLDTFELEGVGEPATLIEARYRACGGEPPEHIPDPREYPVVYPTR